MSPVSVELIDAARAGGRDELELLLRTVWPDAYRLARAILGADQPAQDAAQEACVNVYRTIATLRDSSAFRTWFYRVVVREAAAIKRRLLRDEPVVEPAPLIGDHDIAIDVWGALARLNRALREVVVLRYFEDLTSREIAAVLGIPDGTVRFRLLVAKRRLRPLLDDTEHRTQPFNEARINAV